MKNLRMFTTVAARYALQNSAGNTLGLFRCVALLCIVCSLASVAIAAVPTTNSPPLLPDRPVNFSDRYKLLLVRNIFDANRTAYTNQPTTSTEPTQAQETFTLRGLVLDGGSYSAFIEDSLTGATTKYRVGDAVWDGKITAVGIDHIEFTKGNAKRRIDLGETLSGQAPVVSSPTTAPSPENKVIEMLRERRLRELHGG